MCDIKKEIFSFFLNAVNIDSLFIMLKVDLSSTRKQRNFNAKYLVLNFSLSQGVG